MVAFAVDSAHPRNEVIVETWEVEEVETWKASLLRYTPVLFV
jgi:hypothetical protein